MCCQISARDNNETDNTKNGQVKQTHIHIRAHTPAPASNSKPLTTDTCLPTSQNHTDIHCWASAFLPCAGYSRWLTCTAASASCRASQMRLDVCLLSEGSSAGSGRATPGGVGAAREGLPGLRCMCCFTQVMNGWSSCCNPSSAPPQATMRQYIHVA